MASRLKKSAGLMAAAVALVGGWEGLRTVAYPDITGVPTVCFGETRGVMLGDRYTVDQCKVMLGDALVEFETAMRRCLMAPDAIPDKPYTAFLSLSYNIGSRAFCGSTVARRANSGDLRGACEAIPMWNKAGGRVIKGLVNRRAEERRICLSGLASAAATPTAKPLAPAPKVETSATTDVPVGAMIGVGLALAAGLAIILVRKRRKN